MEVVVCAYSECNEPLPEQRTFNQKYHTDECCRLATNARIMEKYYERKERRKGLVRVCKMPECNTILSRYNDSKICSTCDNKESETSRKALLELL